MSKHRYLTASWLTVDLHIFYIPNLCCMRTITV